MYEEVRNISKKQNKTETKSVFLCKDVDFKNLGREIYVDDVDTPFSFYLIRELRLAKDYQNLAEGEAYFEAIGDSWDENEDFDDLVVKKIYLYVENEFIYYSLYIGSFKSTRSDLRFKLKEWLSGVKVEKKDHSSTSKNSEADSPEIENVMEQLLETSNEIFRLRRIVNELNSTLENKKMEKKATNVSENPIISRSIRTIHLKRAQPLILEDEDTYSEKYAESVYSEIDDEESDEIVINNLEEASEWNTNKYSYEGKLQDRLTKNEEFYGDSLIEDKTHVLRRNELDSNEEINESNSDPVPEKLMHKKGIQRKAENDFSSEYDVEILNEDEMMLDMNLLVLNKQSSKASFLQDDQSFITQAKVHERGQASKKTLAERQLELSKMEDDIYLHFMSKRVRGQGKKGNSHKVKISRSDLYSQITQAGYLHYSWGQVLRQRNEDLLICGRLSCTHLMNNLDYFLDELRNISDQRPFFIKKINCPSEMIRRLEGYILMDQYMQKLSMLPINSKN